MVKSLKLKATEQFIVAINANVQIKLNVTVSDTENSNSCNIVDSLLNDIWNIALAKEGVEAQSMTSKYMKEKVAK